MPKITRLYCFAVYTDDDDDEGVPAIMGIAGPMPLMGADTERIESLLPQAQLVADELNKPLRIYVFTNKEQVGEVTPRQHKGAQDEH